MTNEDYPFVGICDECEGHAFYLKAIPLFGNDLRAKDVWLHKQQRNPEPGERLKCESCSVSLGGENLCWGLRK